MICLDSIREATKEDDDPDMTSNKARPKTHDVQQIRSANPEAVDGPRKPLVNRFCFLALRNLSSPTSTGSPKLNENAWTADWTRDPWSYMLRLSLLLSQLS